MHNEDFLSMYSSHSTDFFVSREVRRFKAESDSIDRFQLDTFVQDLVREINTGEGFRILGWFKSAVDEEGTAVENKNFHIARLEPEKEMTDEQKAKMYRGEGVTAAPRRVEQQQPPRRVEQQQTPRLLEERMLQWSVVWET